MRKGKTAPCSLLCCLWVVEEWHICIPFKLLTLDFISDPLTVHVSVCVCCGCAVCVRLYISPCVFMCASGYGDDTAKEIAVYCVMPYNAMPCYHSITSLQQLHSTPCINCPALTSPLRHLHPFLYQYLYWYGNRHGPKHLTIKLTSPCPLTKRTKRS